MKRVYKVTYQPGAYFYFTIIAELEDAWNAAVKAANNFGVYGVIKGVEYVCTIDKEFPPESN